MRCTAIIACVLIGLQANAQTNYWQQHISYTMSARLEEKTKTIVASESLVYTNNSPLALDFIWFHLWPNAYKDKTTALYQQLQNDSSRKKKVENFKPGFIDGLAFTVNGATAKTEAHPQYNDIIKVLLDKPLQPGGSVTIATPFTVQLPSFFSRSGYEDGEFMVCQWYPKPAVFDKAGWHEMPYLDMGEYYSDYAKYNVTLEVPAKYVVAASGVLQTTGERDKYIALGKKNTGDRVNKPAMYEAEKNAPAKKLVFVADSVPDFAWFADKDFVIQYDTVMLASGRATDAFTYYHYKNNTNWVFSIDYVKDAVRHYSNWIGEYAYPTVQAVEGPKNSSSGGMEYPMVTLITSPNASVEKLDAVITHEVGHNWFMAMLGSNERDHAWQDEGMNTYFMFRYEAEKYRSNSMIGDNIPPAFKKFTEEDFQASIYNAMMQVPMEAAIETKSADFKSSDDYGMSSYLKPAIWMFLLENAIGRDKVDAGFKNYFNKWKFKHPTPEDMKSSFEEAAGAKLNTFFDLLNKKGTLAENKNLGNK